MAYVSYDFNVIESDLTQCNLMLDGIRDALIGTGLFTLVSQVDYNLYLNFTPANRVLRIVTSFDTSHYIHNWFRFRNADNSADLTSTPDNANLVGTTFNMTVVASVNGFYIQNQPIAGGLLMVKGSDDDWYCCFTDPTIYLATLYNSLDSNTFQLHSMQNRDTTMVNGDIYMIPMIIMQTSLNKIQAEAMNCFKCSSMGDAGWYSFAGGEYGYHRYNDYNYILVTDLV